MKNARYLPLLLLTLSACAPTRPTPPDITDESEYYVASNTGQTGQDKPGVARPGVSRLGQKRLLPDPHGGLGTTNDLTLKVTDIKLTNQYTILFLTFGETSSATASYQPRGSSVISFTKDAKLVAGPDPTALKTFNFIKAEGIVLAPNSQTVQADEVVHFRLYFERLDSGIEDFSLFECEDTQTNTCWNVRGMHINNPGDSTTAPNRR